MKWIITKHHRNDDAFFLKRHQVIDFIKRNNKYQIDTFRHHKIVA